MLSVSGRASLKLFDGAGRLVRRLDQGVKSAGGHRLEIRAEELAQGVYFMRLETSKQTKVEKMIVVR